MNRSDTVIVGIVLCGCAVMCGAGSLFTSPAVAQKASPPAKASAKASAPAAKETVGAKANAAGTRVVTKTLSGVKLSLSMPAEFTEVEVEQDPKDERLKGVYTVVWAPPYAKNEDLRPSFVVAVFGVGDDIPANADSYTPMFADGFVSAFPTKYSGFKKAPSKLVVINGRKYRVVTWEGRNMTSSADVHGFAYVGVAGSKCIAIDFRDPTKSQSYRAKADAAAHTLKIE